MDVITYFSNMKEKFENLRAKECIFHKFSMMHEAYSDQFRFKSSTLSKNSKFQAIPFSGHSK